MKLPVHCQFFFCFHVFMILIWLLIVYNRQHSSANNKFSKLNCSRNVTRGRGRWLSLFWCNIHTVEKRYPRKTNLRSLERLEFVFFRIKLWQRGQFWPFSSLKLYFGHIFSKKCSRFLKEMSSFFQLQIILRSNPLL